MSYPTTKTAPQVKTGAHASSATVTNVADGTYNVHLLTPAFAWANGALVVALTNPQPFVKYKGNDVTSSFNNDITNVGWTVTLTNAGVQSTLVFTGGSSTSASGPFTGGTVSGLPSITAQDSGWDTEAGPEPLPEP